MSEQQKDPNSHPAFGEKKRRKLPKPLVRVGAVGATTLALAVGANTAGVFNTSENPRTEPTVEQPVSGTDYKTVSPSERLRSQNEKMNPSPSESAPRVPKKHDSGVLPGSIPSRGDPSGGPERTRPEPGQAPNLTPPPEEELKSRDLPPPTAPEKSPYSDRESNPNTKPYEEWRRSGNSPTGPSDIRPQVPPGTPETPPQPPDYR